MKTLLLSNGRSKQITGHYNNGCAVCDCKLDGVDSLLVSILSGLIIFAVDTILLAVSLAGFPCDLVKGLVCNITGVCDHCDLALNSDCCLFPCALCLCRLCRLFSLCRLLCVCCILRCCFFLGSCFFCCCISGLCCITRSASYQ